MRKELKIEKNPLITSECWSYFKFAIMQTSECFDKWLSCHMRMYTDEKDASVFGETDRYPLSYFGDILNISGRDLCSVSVDEIIPFIIEQINLENYIIFNVNWNRFPERNSDDFTLHDILVYGYDEEQQVIIVAFQVRGVFKEVNVPFDLFRTAYEDGITYFKERPKSLFYRRTFFLPITLLSIKHQYENENVQYDFVLKLTYELKGSVYFIENIGNAKKRKEIHYSGLAALKRFSETLREQAEHSTEEIDDYFWRLMGTCKRICENHNIIYRSMNWFLNSIENSDDVLGTLAEKYGLCCEKMQQNVALLIKYKFTHQKQILIKIADNMDMLLALEPEILEEFIKEFSAVYANLPDNLD